MAVVLINTSGSAITANIAGTGAKMCIGLEITDAAADGNGVLLKALVNTDPRPDATAMLDTSWMCWFEEQAGWSSMGFNDAGWVKPKIIDDYDPEPLGLCKYIYPGVFWFRKKFNSAASGLINVNLIKDAKFMPVRIELFTLQGRKLTNAEIRRLDANTLILQKTVFKNGEVQTKKICVTR